MKTIREADRWPLALIIVGCLLRLVWPSDMEWKGDEIELFEKSLAMAKGLLPWPWVGLKNGAGVLNPGFSFWPWVFFAKFSSDPLAMVRWVQVVNIGAIAAMVALVYRKIKSDDQLLWLWGIALFAVSPLTIVWSRKIWIQNVLPPFGVALLWGHLGRKSFWGALLWGFFGALVGQVHMSGFYWAFALFIATMWVHVRAKTLREISWPGFMVGSALGIALMVPWLKALLTEGGARPVRDWAEILTMKFYTQWFGIAWGIDLKYVAKGVFFRKFLKEPLIGGFPTYLMAVLHAALLATAIFWTFRWINRKRALTEDKILIFYLTTSGVVTGLMMQFSGISVHAHYEIIFAPLLHLWVAALIFRHRKLLKAVALSQLAISLCFLCFIHREDGIVGGGTGVYGPVYRIQGYTLPPTLQNPPTVVESPTQ